MREATAALVILAAAGASIFARKLDALAAATGAAIAFFVFAGSGYTGLAMLAAFFISASLATSFRLKYKVGAGLAEANKGRRNAAQVLANGGVAALASAVGLCMPAYDAPLRLVAAGSLSSAAADTLSSEIGNALGSKFINVLTLKKDRQGLDGVISFEGTMGGLAGSTMIAAIYCTGFGGSRHFIWIVLGGTAGNLVDSLLGASLERRNVLGNNAVNFINTFCGGIATVVLALLFDWIF